MHMLPTCKQGEEFLERIHKAMDRQFTARVFGQFLAHLGNSGLNSDRSVGTPA